MEGEISREYGYCLWAGVEEGQGSEPLSDGIVDEDGNAVFTTHYSALYFNLFKEEVADGIVEEVKPKVLFIEFDFWLSKFFINVNSSVSGCQLDLSRLLLIR